MTTDWTRALFQVREVIDRKLAGLCHDLDNEPNPKKRAKLSGEIEKLSAKYERVQDLIIHDHENPKG